MKKGNTEVFGIAFLDLLSCGLGGVLILMIIFSSMVTAGDMSSSSDKDVQGRAASRPEGVDFITVEITCKADDMNPPQITYRGQWELRQAGLVNPGSRSFLLLLKKVSADQEAPRFTVSPGGSADYQVKLHTPHGMKCKSHNGKKQFTWNPGIQTIEETQP